MEEKEKKIFDMQPESTRRAILRQMNFESNSDPWPPKNWMAVPDAITWEEKVNARPISYQEMKIESELRQKRGEYLAQMHTKPIPNKIIVGPDKVPFSQKRDNAVAAFMAKGSIKERFLSLMESLGLGLEKVSMKMGYAARKDEA